MKVSVSVTTHNHEKYIAQAIDSILMQRVNCDYEIIIGEDCSTDSTRDIVIDFQKRYPDKIRLVLPQKNTGGIEVFVQTLQSSQGQYVALLDGDDYWTSPYKLQKQADFLDSHPECAMCFHNTIKFYEDGSREPHNSHPVSQRRTWTLEDLLLRTNFIETCSAMIRRDLLGKLPEWYYTSVFGDWELFILSVHHGKIGYINEVMGVYRVHSKGVWSGLTRAQQLEGIIKSYEIMNANLDFIYNETIKLMIFELCYELAIEYKKNGDLHQAETYLRRFITEHADRLERYLSDEGGNGAELRTALQRMVLRKKLWFYQHLVLYNLEKRARHFLGWVKRLLSAVWMAITELKRLALRGNTG